MEKIVYITWPSDTAHLTDHLGVATALTGLGASNIQHNIGDDAVADAAPLRIATSPTPPNGMLSMWVDSAIDGFRAPIDAFVSELVAGPVAGYLVTESVPMVNTTHQSASGERTYGFSQIACLQRPAHLDAEAWRSIWHDGHTRVAIDTQSTFGYVQNLVTRPLTPDAPPYAAIVEELFPPAAMTSPNAFFDAEGDDDLLNRNLATMVESTSRFLDYERIDVFPTSQYVL